MTGTSTQVGLTIPTSEVYGPVFQGEGPHAGRVCYFLRLGLCNLHCSWCDTPYTWDEARFDVHDECPPRTASQIALGLPPKGILVLTGGEPLIHQHNPVLHQALANSAIEVHVETNGTLSPNTWARGRVTHFTVSPKLADQGDPEHRRIRPQVLAQFAELAAEGRAAFKVVVRDPDEVKTAFRWFERVGVPEEARWVMPEGVDGQTIIDRATDIAETVAGLGMNLTLRQHVLMYGTERLR